MEIKQKLWVVVTKDHERILKGTDIHRELVDVTDTKDRKSIRVFRSKETAQHVWDIYTTDIFGERDNLEAIPAELIVKL